ncbi:hypothetical protein ACSSS7_002563 [Eimeria intestinalis]
MMCARKTKTASAAKQTPRLPALTTSQPGLKSTVGAADYPYAAGESAPSGGAKDSRMRLSRSLRPQRFCLILFIFPLLSHVCFAVTGAENGSFGEAADAFTPRGKVFNAHSPNSADKGSEEAISQPAEGVTQSPGDLPVGSSLPAAPTEADAALARAMQQHALREKVYDVLVCAFLINLGLVLGVLVVIFVIRLIKAELARRDARLARNPVPRLIIVQCMVPHSPTFPESTCSLYAEGVEPVYTSTACSTPCISSCPSRSTVSV